MKKTIFPKLFYLNNFGFCCDNVFLSSKIDQYIQYVLSNDDNTYLVFLNNLKNEYSYNNYMYILESIINYIIKIYNYTYFDYKKNYDKATERTLININRRYKKILALYDISFDEKEKKIANFNNYKKYKKNRNF